MNNLIALDLAIIPQLNINEIYYKLNTFLKEKNDYCFIFNNERLPHITLLQFYLEEEKISDFIKKVDPLVKDYLKISDQTINFSALKFGSLFVKGLYAPNLEVKCDNNLYHLHEKIIDIANSYQVQNITVCEKTFYKQTAHQICLDIVKKYCNTYSKENFDCHLTLGVGSEVSVASMIEQFQESIPSTTKRTGLILSQMGDFCTVSSKSYKMWS